MTRWRRCSGTSRPCGIGNPARRRWWCEASRSSGPIRTVGRDGLKMMLKRGATTISAVGWGLAHHRRAELSATEPIDIAFKLEARRMERCVALAGAGHRLSTGIAAVPVRIVAGRWRGRRISVPRDDRIRPTADRVREAWMSIVASWIPGARVLDLFAGSGALGLEALSRGAEVAEFVDVAPTSLTTIRENAASLGAGELAVVHRADALRFAGGLAPGAFDVAFADPPYGLGLATRLAELWLTAPFARLLGVEHRVDEVLPGGDDARRYGDTVVTFFGRDSND